MTISCVVFDFDGTLTDVDRHAEAFHRASQEALAATLGCSLASARSQWDEVDAEHSAAPAELAWMVDGNAVAPARGDAYLIANTIVREILLRHGHAEPGPMVLAIHRNAYARIPPAFRDDARATVDEVVARGLAVQVVTNSQTDTVAARLDGLGLRGRARIAVRGNAAKFRIGAPGRPDARFDALAETTSVAGLGRPILLRRGSYFDTLAQVWEEPGSTPERTLVVGDLFELDLAMPSALGCATHLVTRQSTLAHEREAARSVGRGGAGALSAVPSRLR